MDGVPLEGWPGGTPCWSPASAGYSSTSGEQKIQTDTVEFFDVFRKASNKGCGQTAGQGSIGTMLADTCWLDWSRAQHASRLPVQCTWWSTSPVQSGMSENALVHGSAAQHSGMAAWYATKNTCWRLFGSRTRTVAPSSDPVSGAARQRRHLLISRRRPPERKSSRASACRVTCPP